MRSLICADQDGVLAPTPNVTCDFTTPPPVEICGTTACFEG